MSLPPKLRMRLLNYLMRWQRWEEALPIAARLATDQPDGLLYRSALVKVLANLGRFSDAAEIVEELDYQHKGRPNAIAAAGDLEMARGDLPEALKRYLEILKINEKSPKAWRRLAVLYLAAGQPEKARAYCRRVLDFYEQKSGSSEETVTPPDVLRVLSQIHRDAGDSSLASEIDGKLADRQKDEEARLQEDISTAMQLGEVKKLRRPAALQEPIFEHDPEPKDLPSEPPPHLPADALHVLESVFHYSSFRPGQEESIALLLNGRETLVLMPTGAGKSLCYQLPAAMGRKVVVISPLIALMKDQVDGLPATLAGSATLINSTLDSDELERRQAAIAGGRFNLIYAAPERLRQASFLHALRSCGVDLFVVDEVHCVSIWGHDFRPDYLFIPSALDLIGNPPLCGMTATAGSAMRREIETQLHRRLVTVSIGTHRPNLRFEVKQVSRNVEKLRELSRICHEERGSGIIYANSRKKTEEIASFLRTAGVDASHYHAGMEPDERVAAQEAFMNGRCRVMAATVAFGMGVDKPDVRFVAHFAMPKSVENYYQEAGRAGRDGLPARCILLYCPADKAKLTSWAEAQQVTVDEIRSVYECIRKTTRGGGGLVNIDDIQRACGLDETMCRVAINLMQRAELINRGLDIPISFSLTLKHAPGAGEEFREFVEKARLREGQTLAIDARELSQRVGVPLQRLEWLLLGWHHSGWITCRTSGRLMHIERCEGVTGARRLLQEMLDVQRAEAHRKVATITAYAKSSRCRHDFIGQHFGDLPLENCASCDNCAASQAKELITDVHFLVLQSVTSLPIRLGKTGLVKALIGHDSCPIQPHEWPHLGALEGQKRDIVGGYIDDLLEWGYFERDGNPIRPLLVLTSKGRKLAVKGNI